MAAKLDQKHQATQVVRLLHESYPEAHCALKYRTALQLLVATILSAQCTDVRVNIVTPELFKKYPTAADFANASLPELEKAIQSTGFFRNKAKNIQACCKKIVEEHNGKVPNTLDELVELPGVGRKTANVVLGSWFEIPSGVVVDTHVGRISKRLGLTKHNDAVKVEQDLIKIVPQKSWIDFSHQMIFHGRAICIARRPLCEKCTMAKICPKIGVPNQVKHSAESKRVANRVAKVK
jgi:endonuclease III